MANSLEQVLLLPPNMADLRKLKKHKVFFTLKRNLAMVGVCLLIPTKVSNHFPFIFSRTFFTDFIFYFLLLVQAVQATYVVEKWVYHARSKFKDKEACHIAATKA